MSQEQPQTKPEINLGDLFDKDPLLLKDEEIDVIVSHMRKAFANWQAEEATASVNEKRAKPSAGITKEKAKEIKLDDLGL